jgi:hypothetical protein
LLRTAETNKTYFDMKNIFILGMLISSAAICSCQKQNPTFEAQFAHRKTELDAREEALVQREKAVDEREKAVDEREKAVAEREKAVANSRIIQSQRQLPDAAEAEAERQRRIQQLPPELRALIPDRSRMEAERADKDRIKQEQSAQRQSGVQESQRVQSQRQRKFDAMQKSQMSGAAASPGAQTSSPTPSPAIDAAGESEPPTP